MKKLLGIIALFFLVYIILKMGGREIEIQTEKEAEIETLFVSQDVDTRIFFYQGKLIDSNMLLVKKSTELNNSDFEEFKKTFDFDKNTYLIINCQNKDVSEVITESISEKEVIFKLISTEKKNFNNSVLIEIQNLKITNLNLIKLDWEEI